VHAKDFVFGALVGHLVVQSHMLAFAPRRCVAFARAISTTIERIAVAL